MNPERQPDAEEPPAEDGPPVPYAEEPAPARRKAGRDVLLLPLIALIFLGSCIYGFIRNQPPPGVEFGELDDYPPGAVVHSEQGHFYIVRMRDQQNTPEKGLLAISDRDSESRCQIDAYPNERYTRDDGTTLVGLFKDSCQGTVYSLDGTGLNGPNRANHLRRFAVHLVDNRVYIEVPAG